MYAPRCSDHAILVFDFARGRLSDQDAMRAEKALESCEHCQKWWEENFSGPEFGEIDDEVARIFTSTRLPSRRSYRHAWFAAVAAAVVFGLLALIQPSPELAHQRPVEIASMDFEAPAVAAVEMQGRSDDLVATISFEEPVTIVSSDALHPVGDEPVTAMDFESGTFALTNPNT